MFTPAQQKQIEKLGIEAEQIDIQLKNFINGFQYANLAKAATVGDGIFRASEAEIEFWTKIYDELSPTSKIVKFVPASGAATRMFKGLYEYMSKQETRPEIEILLKNIEKYAFIDTLKLSLKKKGKELSDLLNQEGLIEIVKEIIESHGLNYGNLPKGLLQFHKYPGEVRTPADEHIAEGLKYAASKDIVKLHFTISPEHETIFKAEFEKLVQKYKGLTEKSIEITYSFQKKSTDTIAVDMENNPVLNENGLLIFRPGGHGALLENLNDIEADIIFIKNIDNVVPDYLKYVTIKYKKALAGLLLNIKQQITDYLNYLEWHETYSDKHKIEIAQFMKKYLGLVVPDNIEDSIFAGYVKSKLDKPIRVCGMVKNEGEPGGGPFWVYNRKGESTLQIIESTQVDPRNKEQQEILKKATHFNPVDIVCYTKDYNGHKFNLLKYRDPSTGFISEKSIAGKKIKAQELPGLWNGSMAHWITVFVELPGETFNPVKTVNDLLRKEHQPQ